jgi:DNA-binding MarR family transcriptional regulator
MQYNNSRSADRYKMLGINSLGGSWIRDFTKIYTYSEFKVMNILLKYYGYKVISPSITQIAKEADLNESTVDSALRKFKNDGLISWITIKKTPKSRPHNEYTLCLKEIAIRGTETGTIRGLDAPQTERNKTDVAMLPSVNSHRSGAASPTSIEKSDNGTKREKQKQPVTDSSIEDNAPQSRISAIIQEWRYLYNLPIKDERDARATLKKNWEVVRSSLNISDDDMVWFVKSAIRNSISFLKNASQIRGPGWLFMRRKNSSVATWNLYECLTCHYGGVNKIQELYGIIKVRSANTDSTQLGGING